MHSIFPSKQMLFSQQGRKRVLDKAPHIKKWSLAINTPAEVY
jgi:hypothetical protein